jgi:Tol biopolymer transport system component
VKRPTYLDVGRRKLFGRAERKVLGPVDPPPDPAAVADFELGTWRVRPALARMTRADRIVALDPASLAIILILREAPAEGVNRDLLAARLFGPGQHEVPLRSALGFLRRVFSEDGAVRLENAPGDCYRLVIGAPVPGRARSADFSVLAAPAGAVEAWRARRGYSILGWAAAFLVVAGLSVGAFYMLGGPSHALTGRVVSSAVWLEAQGALSAPSFSPDGRRVVYAWQSEGGRSHLYLRALAGGEARQLTKAEGSDQNPVWAPTGGLVAFQRITGPFCELRLIDVEGATDRKLADCAADAAGRITWRRDGASVIFATHAAPDLPRALVAAAIADGALTGVTQPTAGAPGDSDPSMAWSGRRLAFLRTRSPGVADLLLLDSGMPRVTAITQDGAPVHGSAWLPASRALVIASPRSGRDALYTVPADGGIPRFILGGDADLSGPALAPDGRHLLYAAWRTGTRLIELPFAADAEPKPVAWSAGSHYDRDACPSRDGLRMAFVSNRSGHDELWIANPADGSAAQLTHAGLDHLETPGWSGDGRYLVVAGGRLGRIDVWRVDAASGAMTAVTQSGMARAPAFSRDGRYLYFAERNRRWQIWRWTWESGGRREQVTTEGGLRGVEAVDGDTLYYVRPDRPGLWKRSREPGGDETLVTGDLAPEDWNNWTATRQGIYFVVRPDGEHGILALFAFETGAVSHIRPLPRLDPRSGLAVDATGGRAWVATISSRESRLELATLE